MAKQGQVFDRLRAASGSTLGDRWVYRWLVHHHDEFAQIIDRADRPTWEVIATELHTEGLTKKDGTRLTAAYVRHLWWRAAKAHREQPMTPATVAPQAKAVPVSDRQPAPSAPAFNPQETADTPAPGFSYKPSKLK